VVGTDQACSNRSTLAAVRLVSNGFELCRSGPKPGWSQHPERATAATAATTAKATPVTRDTNDDRRLVPVTTPPVGLRRARGPTAGL
jgi:hypothetical protein